MIEEEAKSAEEIASVMHLAASISAAIMETFEEKNITKKDVCFILKCLTLTVLHEYEDSADLAESIFKEVYRSLRMMQGFKLQTTFTIQ